MNEYDPLKSGEVANLDLSKGCSLFVDGAIQCAYDELKNASHARTLEVADVGEGNYAIARCSYESWTTDDNKYNGWAIIHKEGATEAPLLAWIIDHDFAVPILDFTKRTDGRCSYLQVGPNGEDKSYLATEDDDISQIEKIVAIRDFVDGNISPDQLRDIINPLKEIELEKHRDRIEQLDRAMEQRRQKRLQSALESDKVNSEPRSYNAKIQSGTFKVLDEIGGVSEKEYKYRMPNDWSFVSEEGRSIKLAVAGKGRDVDDEDLPVVIAVTRDNVAVELGSVEDLKDQLADQLGVGSLKLNYNVKEYQKKIWKRLKIPDVMGVSISKKKKIQKRLEGRNLSFQAKQNLESILTDDATRFNRKAYRQLQRSGLSEYQRCQALIDAAVIRVHDHKNDPPLPTKSLSSEEGVYFTLIHQQVSGGAPASKELQESDLYQHFTQIKGVNLSVKPDLKRKVSDIFDQHLGSYDDDLEEVISVARKLARMSLTSSGVITKFPYQKSHIKMLTKAEIQEKLDAVSVSIDLQPHGSQSTESAFRGEVYIAHPNNRTEEEIKKLKYYLGSFPVDKLVSIPGRS